MSRTQTPKAAYHPDMHLDLDWSLKMPRTQTWQDGAILSKEQVRNVRKELDGIEKFIAGVIGIALACCRVWGKAQTLTLTLQKGRPLVDAAVLSCSSTRGSPPPGAALWYST